LGKTVKRVWWYACFTLERRVVLKPEGKPTDVGKGGAEGGELLGWGCEDYGC